MKVIYFYFQSNRSQPAIGLKHTPKSRVSFFWLSLFYSKLLYSEAKLLFLEWITNNNYIIMIKGC